MMVKYATRCDYPKLQLSHGTELCWKKSPEYESWPECRGCGKHTCPEHQRPASKTDADVDSPETCLCLDCEEEV